MRTVEIKLLPDGSGRVCVHWFQRLDDGPVKTPKGAVQTNRGPMEMGGAVGRIACQPREKSVAPRQVAGRTLLLCHSDEPRAVTCPACMETEEFKAAMKQIELLVDTANAVKADS